MKRFLEWLGLKERLHKKIDPSQSLAKVVGNPKYETSIDEP
jgi:hypothetical protein